MPFLERLVKADVGILEKLYENLTKILDLVDMVRGLLAPRAILYPLNL